MAWNDRAVARTNPKEVRCKKCKNGKHDDCDERACQCHCLVRSDDSPPRAQVPMRLRRDITFCLQRMRDHGVVGRLGGEYPDYYMVWKPSVKLLPDEVRTLMRTHRMELLQVLAPHHGPRGLPRPHWTIGALHACACCENSTVWINPLGEPMHPTCGYLNRHQLESLQRNVYKAPKMALRSGTRRPHPTRLG